MISQPSNLLDTYMFHDTLIVRRPFYKDRHKYGEWRKVQVRTMPRLDLKESKKRIHYEAKVRKFSNRDNSSDILQSESEFVKTVPVRHCRSGNKE